MNLAHDMKPLLILPAAAALRMGCLELKTVIVFQPKLT
jgi:hypothetical protein